LFINFEAEYPRNKRDFVIFLTFSLLSGVVETFSQCCDNDLAIIFTTGRLPATTANAAETNGLTYRSAEALEVIIIFKNKIILRGARNRHFYSLIDSYSPWIITHMATTFFYLMILSPVSECTK
jgi:hypothetical protein